MITLLLLVRATYMYGVVLHAHPVRGESHNQHNTTSCNLSGGVMHYNVALCVMNTTTLWHSFIKKCFGELLKIIPPLMMILFFFCFKHLW